MDRFAGDYPDSVLITQYDFIVGTVVPKVGQPHEDCSGVEGGHGSYRLDADDKEYHVIVKRGKVWAVWEAR